eukprot:gnl/MRDRNA2_/MRDRNA2_114332_c0_seq1.p1 gnl/MRDRNA2_/MRDRNA2_114332_c0~~gnl/MRDRNA2_/MRDRNA2_114332_c0_seq1.p1  ORF type:complete len:174 (+),score=50.02 gnl/MRDRNA2_/MRDRNA2_114332_c0_seq1:83-604(+)
MKREGVFSTPAKSSKRSKELDCISPDEKRSLRRLGALGPQPSFSDDEEDVKKQPSSTTSQAAVEAVEVVPEEKPKEKEDYDGEALITRTGEGLIEFEIDGEVFRCTEAVFLELTGGEAKGSMASLSKAQEIDRAVHSSEYTAKASNDVDEEDGGFDYLSPSMNDLYNSILGEP